MFSPTLQRNNLPESEIKATLSSKLTFNDCTTLPFFGVIVMFVTPDPPLLVILYSYAELNLPYPFSVIDNKYSSLSDNSWNFLFIFDASFFASFLAFK